LHFVGNPFEIGAEGALRHEPDGAIVFTAGHISALGAADAVLAENPGAEIIDLGRSVIAPGFVDCHVHYPQTGIIASYGAQLLDWLTLYTFPEETRFADVGHARAAARLFFDEQLRNGTTTSCSFCTIHPESVDAFFEEAARRGAFALGGKVMMDCNAPDGLRDTAQSGYDDSKALIGRWHGRGRARYAVSPRFAPTSSRAQLEAASALWREFPQCLMQTHLSENNAEIAWVRTLFPECADYLDVYDRFGLLGPKAVFGHAIHLSGREADRLAEAGASVAHCPTSNHFLGSGECDVTGLSKQGVRVGLATDTGGGSSFSMFQTMKAAYEVAQRRGASLPCAHLWWLTTQGAARALHSDERIGNLAVGLDADAIVFDLDSTPLIAQRVARAENFAEALFAQIILADDRAIRQTWVNGQKVWDRDDNSFSIPIDP